MITTENIDVSAEHKDKTTKHNVITTEHTAETTVITTEHTAETTVITTEHTAETTEHCVKAPNNKNEQQKTVMAFHIRQ